MDKNMQDQDSLKDILESLSMERRDAILHLRKIILENIPDGFSETAAGGMIHYVIPLEKYPGGYLDDPSRPLPFISLASQKNHLAFYHMGLYADPELLAWFTGEYQKRAGRKPDMGKSCLRFKKLNEIPYDLIGELAARITPDEWINRYDRLRRSRR